MNRQTIVFKDGRTSVVEDNGLGLSLKSLPARDGLNIFIRHKNCGTYTRYLLKETLPIVVSGQFKGWRLETPCDVCKQEIEIEIINIENN